MNVLRLAWSGYQTESSLNLEAEAIESTGMNYLRPRGNGPIPEKLSTYDVIIVNSKFQAHENFLEKFHQADRKQLLITATSGYDHIELDKCEELNIKVCRIPQARTKNVARHTFAMMQSLLRDIPRSWNSLQMNQWNRADKIDRVQSAENVTFGLIGFGQIGQAVLDLLRTRNPSSIRVYDPLKQETIKNQSGIQNSEFQNLLKESDLVSLHTDLNPSTQGMIGQNEIELLSDGFIVNTARGELMDYDSLYTHLSSENLNGAGLDVFPEEPLQESRWSALNNTILTPHTGGFGPDLIDDMREGILETLVAFNQDEPLPGQVQPRSDDQIDQLRSGPDASHGDS